jgi:hypothetical protein
LNFDTGKLPALVEYYKSFSKEDNHYLVRLAARMQSTGSFVAALPIRAASLHGSGLHYRRGMKRRKSKTVHLFFDD